MFEKNSRFFDARKLLLLFDWLFQSDRCSQAADWLIHWSMPRLLETARGCTMAGEECQGGDEEGG